MNAESTGETVGRQPNIPPTPAAASADRTFEVLCHVLAFSGLIIPFVGNIVGPLVLWLLKKDQSPGVDAHGKESVNFQISMTIWTLLCMASLLVVVGVVLTPIVVIANIVLVIIAAIKASNGEFYRYPLTIRFIK